MKKKSMRLVALALSVAVTLTTFASDSAVLSSLAAENETDEVAEVPVESAAPAEAPVESEAPVVTETPVETEAPVVSAEPTEAPVESAEPTEAPVESAEPTAAPVETEAPAESAAPVETEVPAEDEELVEDDELVEDEELEDDAELDELEDEDLEEVDEEVVIKNVTYTVDPVGAAVVYGDKEAEEGSTLLFTVMPSAGYDLTAVTVGETELSAKAGVGVSGKLYSIESVTEDTEVVISLTATEEHPAFSDEVNVNGVIISVSAEEGVLPAGIEVQATEVTASIEGAFEEEVLGYDINLVRTSDGSKLDNSWSDNGSVHVSFYGEKINEMTEQADEVSIVYMNDDYEVEETVAVIDTADSMDAISFDASHFTIYAMVPTFEWNSCFAKKNMEVEIGVKYTIEDLMKDYCKGNNELVIRSVTATYNGVAVTDEQVLIEGNDRSSYAFTIMQEPAETDVILLNVSFRWLHGFSGSATLQLGVYSPEMTRIDIPHFYSVTREYWANGVLEKTEVEEYALKKDMVSLTGGITMDMVESIGWFWDGQVYKATDCSIELKQPLDINTSFTLHYYLEKLEGRKWNSILDENGNLKEFTCDVKSADMIARAILGVKGTEGANLPITGQEILGNTTDYMFTVNYVDTNNEPIMEAVSTTYASGAEYRVDAPAIAGYVLSDTVDFYSGVANTNKVLTFKYDVATATADVTATGYADEYDGQEHVVVASSTAEGATIQYSTDDGATWSDTAPGRTNVGTTNVLVRVSAGGYLDATTTVAITVEPRDVVVTANGASKTVGQGDPAFTASVSDLADGEESVLDGHYTVVRAEGETAGTYTVSVVYGEEFETVEEDGVVYYLDGNYRVALATGIFTIAAAPVQTPAPTATPTPATPATVSIGDEPVAGAPTPDEAVLGASRGTGDVETEVEINAEPEVEEEVLGVRRGAQTGDQSNTFAWAAVLVVSMAAFGGYTFYRKREKSNK